MSNKTTDSRDIAKSSAQIQEFINHRSQSAKNSKHGKSVPDFLVERLNDSRSPITGVLTQTQPLKAYERPDLQKLAIDDYTNQFKMPDALQLNSRVIETWINSILKDAEVLEISNRIKPGDTIQPLQAYQADRLTFMSVGLSSAEVDRVFRGLFVYSIGFYEMLNKTFERIEDKYKYISSLWRVYAILLEYCCQIDYKLSIAAIVNVNTDEISSIWEECSKKVKEAENEQDKLVGVIDQLNNDLNAIERNRVKEARRAAELEEELMTRGASFESEVSLRLSFEGRLNTLFANQRDMELKIEMMHKALEYERTQKEHQSENMAMLKHKAGIATGKNWTYERQAKENSEKIAYGIEHQVSLENKLQESNDEIVELKELLATQKEEMRGVLENNVSLRLECEQCYTMIDRTKSEKERAKNISKELKRKSELTDSKVNDLRQESISKLEQYKHFEQEYVRVSEISHAQTSLAKKQKVGVQNLELRMKEVIAERDAQINFREAAEVKEQDAVKQLEIAMRELQSATLGRHEAQEQNAANLASLETYMEDLRKKHEELLDSRKQYDILHGKFTNLENEHDIMENRRKSVESNDRQKRQVLKEKIENLQTLLEDEKKVRESWVRNFENEQKETRYANNQLIEAQAQIKERDLKIASLQKTKEEKLRNISKEQERGDKLHEKILQFEIKTDEKKRKIKVLKKIIEMTEDRETEKDKETKEYREKVELMAQEQIERANMETEDIRAYGMQIRSKYDQLLVISNAAQISNTDLKQRLDDLYARKQELEQVNERLEAEVQNMTQDNSSIKSKSVRDQTELDELRHELNFAQIQHKTLFAQLKKQKEKATKPLDEIRDRMEEAEEELSKIQEIRSAAMSTLSQAGAGTVTDLVDSEAQTDIGGDFFSKAVSMPRRIPKSSNFWSSMSPINRAVTIPGPGEEDIDLQRQQSDTYSTLGPFSVVKNQERTHTSSDLMKSVKGALWAPGRYPEISNHSPMAISPTPPPPPPQPHTGIRPSTSKVQSTGSIPTTTGSMPGSGIMSNFVFDVPNSERFALVTPGFNQFTPTNSATRSRPVTGRHNRTLTADDIKNSGFSLRRNSQSNVTGSRPSTSKANSAARTRNKYFETGIKAQLRQANSRNKDNFEFM